jgi:branched-chain amino acid transport system substrate-binding protein
MIAGFIFSYANTTPAAKPPIFLYFGAALPMSGPAASWGIEMDRGLKLAADEINAAGGFVVRGQRYHWKIITYDTAYVPSKAVDAVTKLVEKDKVKFMQVVGAGLIAAVQPIYEQAGVLNICAGRSAAYFMGKDHPLTFASYTSIGPVNLVTYPYFRDKLRVKTIALINPDDAYGRDSSKDSRKAAEFLGLKVVAEEFYERATNDFYPLLTRIMGTKPDMIDNGVGPVSSSALLVKQAHELGYKGVHYMGNPVSPEVAIKVAGGEALEGAYMPDMPLAQTAEQLAFKEKVIARYGEAGWGSMLFDFYSDFLWPLTKAIEAANSVDPQKVAKALTKVKLKHIRGGTAYFGGSKLYGLPHALIKPVPLIQFKGGKWITVFTEMPMREYLD